MKYSYLDLFQSQVLAAGPELQGLTHGPSLRKFAPHTHGQSSNGLMGSPSRNVVKSSVSPRLSPPLNPERQADQTASLICSLEKVEKSSMLISNSNDQQIFKSIRKCSKVNYAA